MRRQGIDLALRLCPKVFHLNFFGAASILKQLLLVVVIAELHGESGLI